VRMAGKSTASSASSSASDALSTLRLRYRRFSVSEEGRPTLDADRLLDVLDGVAVLIYVVDPEGRTIHANRAACEFVGRSHEDVIGKDPEEFVDVETARRWKQHARTVLETGRPLDVEDGWGGRTLLTHKTPLIDAEGRPVAVLGISTDITDRKRREDELRRREELLTEAQTISGVGSWHWDIEAREVTWSDELCRIFGFEPGEAPIGPESLELVHPDDRDRVRAAGEAAIQGEAPMELDFRIIRADGSERVVHCRAAVTTGPGGEPRRLDGTTADVTDRRRAERHLAQAQQLAQLGSWDWDLDRDEITMSEELYSLLGVERERFVPSHGALIERVLPEDRERLTRQVDEALRTGGAFDSFVRLRRGDDEIREVRLRGSVLPGPERSRGHLLGICQDLTDLRHQARALAQAFERFRGVFERAPIGMALVGSDGRFALVNEALAEFLGRSRAELASLTVRDVTHPDDLPSSVEAMRSMEAGELDEYNAEKRYLRPDGSARWGALRASIIRDDEGRRLYALALVQDITERRRAEHRRAAMHGVASVMARGASLSEAVPELVETIARAMGWERGAAWLADPESGELRLAASWPEGAEPPAAGEDGLTVPLTSGPDELGRLAFRGEGTGELDAELATLAEALGAQIGEFVVRKRAEELLVHQALHDSLTGLPNRMLFFDRLDHALARQRRDHTLLAVLFLDFDGFKEINDRFGHAGGDEVLKRAAKRVSAAVRAEDTVARFGGDELVILSEHHLGPEGGACVAVRVLEALREPIELHGEQVTLSASIGVCIADEPAPPRDELLRAADAAMYRAKAAGPGRYVIAE
jgi:diguanylate cyclase (GGDEF)-like protein/PAS domain S-box-containing protein